MENKCELASHRSFFREREGERERNPLNWLSLLHSPHWEELLTTVGSVPINQVGLHEGQNEGHVDFMLLSKQQQPVLKV